MKKKLLWLSLFSLFLLGGCAYNNTQLVEEFSSLELESYEQEEGVVVELPHVVFRLQRVRV